MKSSMNILACLFVSLTACAPSVVAVRTVVVNGPGEPQSEALPQYHFNGVDQMIAFDNPQLPQQNMPRTLSAWFRTSAKEGAHVIANWGTPSPNQRFGLLVDAGHVKLVGENQDIMTGDSFADGAWHHAAATYQENGQAVIYIDGKAEVSGVLQLDTEGTQLVIGNAPDGHAPELWNGDLDRIQVFPRALAGNEIGLLIERGVAAGSHDVLDQHEPMARLPPMRPQVGQPDPLYRLD